MPPIASADQVHGRCNRLKFWLTPALQPTMTWISQLCGTSSTTPRIRTLTWGGAPNMDTLSNPLGSNRLGRCSEGLNLTTVQVWADIS